MATTIDTPVGQQLFALGWRAGSVVPAEYLNQFIPHLRRGLENPVQDIVDDTWGIVVSQTCDLVALKDEQEPYAELLLAQRLNALKPRTQFCDLRSTRTLDFRPDQDQYPNLILTANAATDRYLVPRELLLKTSPDPDRCLSTSAIRRIHGWFALRCSRPAWPEYFVKRIRSQKKELEAALKELPNGKSEVRVAIEPNDGDLPDDESYRVAVYFVIDAELYKESTAVREQASLAYATFVSVLHKCQGIHLNEDLSDVMSGDEFTWQMTQSTDLWDFAHLSPYE